MSAVAEERARLAAMRSYDNTWATGDKVVTTGEPVKPVIFDSLYITGIKRPVKRRCVPARTVLGLDGKYRPAPVYAKYSGLATGHDGSVQAPRVARVDGKIPRSPRVYSAPVKREKAGSPLDSLIPRWADGSAPVRHANR